MYFIILFSSCYLFENQAELEKTQEAITECNQERISVESEYLQKFTYQQTKNILRKSTKTCKHMLFCCVNVFVRHAEVLEAQNKNHEAAQEAKANATRVRQEVKVKIFLFKQNTKFLNKFTFLLTLWMVFV